MSNNFVTKRTKLILSNYIAEYLGFLDIKIHSVFPNGFNLIIRENQLLFIGKLNQPLSAYGMAIEPQVFDEIQPYLQVNDCVELDDQCLIIRTQSRVIELAWTEVFLYDLALPRMKLTSSQQQQLLHQLNAFPLWNDSGFVLNPLLTNLFNQWSKNAMDDEDHLYSLVGAGVGLTPSGDDFIQGLIMMEWLTQGSTHIRSRVSQILTRRQTTDVSKSYYEALFKGHVNETWIKLFKAVEENQPYKIKMFIEEIREYGSTSGNDLLLGVQKYLQRN